MSLLDTDDVTLRDRMERSPELLLREVRELQAIQAIRDRARAVVNGPPVKATCVECPHTRHLDGQCPENDRTWMGHSLVPIPCERAGDLDRRA